MAFQITVHLTVQQLIEANMEETIKVHITVPLWEKWGESTSDQWGSPC